jgi:hypothetical protein
MAELNVTPSSLKGWLILVGVIAAVISVAFILEARKPGRVSGLPIIKQLVMAGAPGPAGTTGAK